MSGVGGSAVDEYSIMQETMKKPPGLSILCAGSEGGGENWSRESPRGFVRKQLPCGGRVSAVKVPLSNGIEAR